MPAHTVHVICKKTFVLKEKEARVSTQCHNQQAEVKWQLLVCSPHLCSLLAHIVKRGGGGLSSPNLFLVNTLTQPTKGAALSFIHGGSFHGLLYSLWRGVKSDSVKLSHGEELSYPFDVNFSLVQTALTIPEPIKAAVDAAVWR